jgi:hypothetical protein
MQWHYLARNEYVCDFCRRRVHGAEIVLMFSTSETYWGDREKLLIPFQLLTDRERVKLANPKQPKTLRGKEDHDTTD